MSKARKKKGNAKAPEGLNQLVDDSRSKEMSVLRRRGRVDCRPHRLPLPTDSLWIIRTLLPRAEAPPGAYRPSHVRRIESEGRMAKAGRRPSKSLKYSWLKSMESKALRLKRWFDPGFYLQNLNCGLRHAVPSPVTFVSPEKPSFYEAHPRVRDSVSFRSAGVYSRLGRQQVPAERDREANSCNSPLRAC